MISLNEVSVVVPVLNDAAALCDLLSDLRQASFSEVVVVDGGSADHPDQYLTSEQFILAPQGRATQINAGIRHSSGTWIWILHADSRISTHALEALKNRNQAKYRWGRFDVQLSGNGSTLRVIETLMNWRSALTSICTGDQGMYFSRSLLEEIGGFPVQDCMEDVELAKRFKRAQSCECISAPIETSSRKWERDGVLNTVLQMWWLRLRYFFGADPTYLKKLYYRHP